MSPKKTEFTVHDERNERPMHEKIQTLDFKILRREQHGISLYTIVSTHTYFTIFALTFFTGYNNNSQKIKYISINLDVST